MQKLLIPALATCALTLGCNTSTPSGENSATTGKSLAEKAAKKSATLFPGFDPQADLKSLEGKWLVNARFNQKVPAVWTVTGNKLVSVTGDKTTESTLSIPYPGQLKMSMGDNSATFLGYTHDGDKKWIGLGRGGFKVGENYYVAVMRGVVHFDGKTCKYLKEKMSFGDDPVRFEEGTPVKCSVDGAKFKYQVPKFMKDGEFQDRWVNIVGNALLDDQRQKDHSVVKAP